MNEPERVRDLMYPKVIEDNVTLLHVIVPSHMPSQIRLQEMSKPENYLLQLNFIYRFATSKYICRLQQKTDGMILDENTARPRNGKSPVGLTSIQESNEYITLPKESFQRNI